MTSTTEEPKGLGGWLILPALGLIVLPIRIGFMLYSDFLPIFQEGYWEVLTDPASESYHHLWAPLIIVETIGNGFFILFDLVLIFLFFTKSHRFPLLFIIFLASNLLFVVGDFFMADLIPAIAEQEDEDSFKEMTRSIVNTAIWIPYFLVSKRVKNTFVKPTSEE